MKITVTDYDTGVRRILTESIPDDIDDKQFELAATRIIAMFDVLLVRVEELAGVSIVPKIEEQ